MKATNWLVSIALLISIPMITISCGQQNTEWKGTIEEEDGVIIVKNPKDPVYSEDIFSTEEELSVGEAEGQEEYIFSRIFSIDVDKDGNLYVLDHNSAHIRVFDQNGGFLRTIGSKGQGPGEMLRPLFIQVTAKEEVMAWDPSTRRLIFFSLDGKYIKQVLTATTPIPTIIKINSRGEFIGSPLLPPPVGEELVKYNSVLEPVMTISKINRKSYRSGELRMMKPSLRFAVTKDDNIVWGRTDKYELQILNPEGRLIKKITKDYKPLRLTKKEQVRLKQRHSRLFQLDIKVVFPKYFPAFDDVFNDEEGKLYVRTYERVEGEESFFYFDVFDAEGKYIAKIPIKISSAIEFIWKKDKLYTIKEDKDGFHVVKRYKVNWNF